MTIETQDRALTIADGRLKIGYVYEEGGTFHATDAEGKALGNFADIAEAHTAIIECRKAKLRGNTRNG